MTSRWAFEASMVAQFKDNDFEREFYEQDKIIAGADYKKIYYVPTLESKLDFVNLNYLKKEADPKEIAAHLDLIQSEIERELAFIGKQHFPEVTLLHPSTYDSAVYQKTKHFLVALKQYYTNRATTASKEKEKRVDEMTQEMGGKKEFESYRESYQNEAIGVLVKNQDEPSRIIEARGQLIQKVYPIYKDPDPDHFIDFDAQFYLPSKHFMNVTIDTFSFNLCVIWSISILLYITLFYNVFRKIIGGFENISLKR